MGVSVFRPTYTDGDAKKKRQKVYRVQVRLKGQKVLVPGFTSRSESEHLGEQIERLMGAKMSGQPVSGDLVVWIKGLPMSILQKLAEKGLIETTVAASQGKSLESHIEDYAAELAKRKDDPKHVKQVKNVLLETARSRKWVVWQDVTSAGLMEYLSKLDGVAPRTYNHKLGCWKSFARWMCSMGRAETSPVEYIAGRSQKKDRKRVRRALSLEDLQNLLRVTRGAKKRHHMTGWERALIYQVAVETGLRLGELRALKINAFDLKAGTVLIRSSISKNAKTAPLRLQADTVAMLAELFHNQFPANQAFPRLPVRGADMLKKDLRDAKIPYQDGYGEVFDFHAFRGETATLGALAGVDPGDLKEHMRHSDIHLTMDVYAKVQQAASDRTMAAFPRLVETKKEQESGNQVS